MGASQSSSSGSSGGLSFEWPPFIPRLNPKDVTILPTILGKGGTGQVFEGRYKGKRVAVKVFNIFDYTNFQKELDAFSKIISSPYIVPIHGAYLEGVKPVIVMDYIEKGNLYDYVMAQGPDFKCGHPLWSRFLSDICEAMSSIHAAGMIHRDLKPQNILVVSDDPYYHASTIKICDLCLSRPDDNTQTLFIGSGGYTAPEIYDNDRGHCTSAADVFSFGMLLYFMLSRSEPFS
eukprot:TRINITY_DN5521_c2_g1_i3.p1 TRINITY_DN5521_c2_g1~~TRINITY_DN5521_c2_g1_i3.p1  ORF type:complete len:233 (+),score=32.08 TRINITY_DN5521_c2_g1_i3:8-706(+)